MFRVALLDSGFDDPAPAARRIFVEGDGKLDHGRALAAAIRDAAPEAALLDGRIFGDSLATRVSAVAAAIRWAVGEGAKIINLSLGLRDDREDLRNAVAEAVAAGVLVVAAAPARGGPVYPAGYPGVIRATGDARCGVDDLSWINDAAADFGASPAPLPAFPRVAGASMAAARVAGALAALASDNADPVAALRDRCRFTGRERRS